MNLPKIHSITKKIFVALLGAFLAFFLLFHAGANLLILRNDSGLWYNTFCHFMGTNIIVKVFELALLGAFALHIVITLWLKLTNMGARPTLYHYKPQTKTHTGSTWMVVTGLLIIACLVLHFTDFYFVKLGITKGVYMVKVEDLDTKDAAELAYYAQQQDMMPEDFVDMLEPEFEDYYNRTTHTAKTDIPEDFVEAVEQYNRWCLALPVLDLVNEAQAENRIDEEATWITNISAEAYDTYRAQGANIPFEPDFYHKARQIFTQPYIAFLYFIFFAIVWLHMRHSIPSLFQTLGLNNYKYHTAIEVLSQIYVWVVIACFFLTVFLVLLGI